MDTISISKLSKQALKKLEKGLPVRVKAGEGHTLELDSGKVAKLKKAFDKAKGMTLTLNEKEVTKSIGAGLFAGGGLYAQSSMRGRGKKSITHKDICWRCRFKQTSFYGCRNKISGSEVFTT